MSINYKGNFMNQLYKNIENNPKATIGEILFSFLREARLKKHFFYSTDEEIYNSLENLNNQPKEEETPLNEKDYAIWVGKNLFKLDEDELEKILFVEEKEDGEDKQGFMFKLEQISIIKK